MALPYNTGAGSAPPLYARTAYGTRAPSPLYFNKQYGYSGIPQPGFGGVGPFGGGGAPGAAPGGAGRWVSPDYSGILGAYTSDARARFGAGLQAMKAQRLSGARGAINRLGVRDVPGMLGKLQQYGLTQADLQGAADNPWSELKALDFGAKRQWQGDVANRAARGGFRSGGTIGAQTDIENERARNEALITQDTLQQLSEGLFGEKEWERTQRDQMEQAIAQQQAALAGAYQPYWQPS